MEIRKLIIIGNGFDLAHNLPTSYQSFAEANSDHPAIVAFHELVNDLAPIINKSSIEESRIYEWFYFEDWIACISRYYDDLEMNSSLTTGSANDVETEMQKKNELFNQLRNLLKEYLQKIELKNDVIMLPNVENEFLADNTFAISFNYTETVKKYTNHYDFIHGNIIDDGDIVFGFANNILTDNAPVPYAWYDKELQKFRLSYIRFLHHKGYTDLKEYMDELEPHLKTLFSGKGGWDFPEQLVNDTIEYDISLASDRLKEFYKTCGNKQPFAYYNKFHNVKEIVIMGHGLKSDQLFFSNLSLEINSSLEKVVLYTFPEENIKDRNKKVKLLNEYFGDHDVVLKYYSG